MAELFLGDCLDVLPTLDENSVDMVLVDLPYGQTACKWDSIIDLDEMWKQLKRVAKPTTPFIFFTTTKFGYELIKSNPKWFRYDLVWEKTMSVGFLSANKMPLRSHEMMYVFYEKLPTYKPQKTQGKPYVKKGLCKNGAVYGGNEYEKSAINTGDRHPTSVVKVSNSNHKSKHPTQKPVELCEWLVKSYSNEEDVVLDFTMGSGTTGVACMNTNRRFVGVERDADYFKICVERIDG
jgi:site-specific DNA-methyltransferase (adenine-specific)